MKPILVRKRDTLNASIEFDGEEYDFFYNPLHYHPEFELTLIVKSFGQRRIGDNIENFHEGDLVLVGNNLPHVWKNDDIFFDDRANMKAQAICVKFLPDFAGRDFLERPEMQGIKTVLNEKAPQGIKLLGELSNRVEELMLEMPDLDESDRFISLLQILNHISKSNEYQLLASLNYRNENHKNTNRINVVLDYIMEHYEEELSLENMAALVNMNKNAFCRFFKKGTRKNLFAVINEVRIGKACQHLTETEMNVLQICYSCGFNNISNFNKTFKKITGISPLQYRRRMKKFDSLQEV
jgi:AraC-like DNA-binding protein